MRLLDRIRDLVAVARAMLRPEEQIAEPVIVPGPLLKQHPAVQRAAQRADRIAEAIDRLTSERSGILRVSPLEFRDLVAITDARVVVRDGVPEFEAHCSFGPVTVRLADKERDHAQADPDPRRGADDRGGDPAASPAAAAVMIAPHVIAPCPTCGAPARTGAVHYASVTEQRPCPASWKGRGA